MQRLSLGDPVRPKTSLRQVRASLQLFPPVDSTSVAGRTPLDATSVALTHPSAAEQSQPPGSSERSTLIVRRAHRIVIDWNPGACPGSPLFAPPRRLALCTGMPGWLREACSSFPGLPCVLRAAACRESGTRHARVRGGVGGWRSSPLHHNFSRNSNRSAPDTGNGTYAEGELKS